MLTELPLSLMGKAKQLDTADLSAARVLEELRRLPSPFWAVRGALLFYKCEVCGHGGASIRYSFTLASTSTRTPVRNVALIGAKDLPSDLLQLLHLAG